MLKNFKHLYPLSCRHSESQSFEMGQLNAVFLGFFPQHFFKKFRLGLESHGKSLNLRAMVGARKEHCWELQHERNGGLGRAGMQLQDEGNGGPGRVGTRSPGRARRWLLWGNSWENWGWNPITKPRSLPKIKFTRAWIDHSRPQIPLSWAASRRLILRRVLWNYGTLEYVNLIVKLGQDE